MPGVHENNVKTPRSPHRQALFPSPRKDLGTAKDSSSHDVDSLDNHKDSKDSSAYCTNIISDISNRVQEKGREQTPIYSVSSSEVKMASDSSAFNMDRDMSSLSTTPAPPLHPTEVHHTLQTMEGLVITPEILGEINKGFFMADNDWTCYRRNYFSLNCSYTLQPIIPSEALYLVQQHGGSGPQVHSFSILTGAVADGRGGKSIDLVLHIPKRDKGPQERPARIKLAPRPPAPQGLYGSSIRSIYDAQSLDQNAPPMEATFERVQFTTATANNGKRRAAQQYYHLLIELFADLGASVPDRWIKIASQMSAPLVVRGRSPGHYQGERRRSNTSTGPGMSAGGAYAQPATGSRTPGDIAMPGVSWLGLQAEVK